MKESITPQDVVNLLNEAAAMDPIAVYDMMTNYVDANNELVRHPTIQCGPTSIGPLGFLNGLFGYFDDGPKKGSGPIMMTRGMDMKTQDYIKESIRFSLVENK